MLGVVWIEDVPGRPSLAVVVLVTDARFVSSSTVDVGFTVAPAIPRPCRLISADGG